MEILEIYWDFSVFPEIFQIPVDFQKVFQSTEI